MKWTNLLLVFGSLILFGGLRSDAQTTFRSLVGAFEIKIDAERDGQSGFVGGVKFRWSVDGAEINIGFGDRRGLPRAVRDGEFSAEEFVLNYYNQYSKRGERILASEVEIDGHPASEFRSKTDRVFFIARVMRIADKIYVLDAAIPIEKSEENLPKVLKIFDSFRLIPDQIVSAEINKLITDSTPEPFAASVKPTKPVSDTADQNLKKAPKTVLTETARYGLDQWLLGKKTSKLEEFDERGFLVKEIEYDDLGMPRRIVAYGFLNGKRVARVNHIQSETSIVGFEIPMSGKFDERFDESYTYRYLGRKLTEVRNFWSNNALHSRTTYRFSKNTRKVEYFDGGTRPFSRVVEEIDDRGNVRKYTGSVPEANKLVAEEPYEIEYDKFDSAGNWTQRSIYRWYGLEGKGKRFGEEVEYRTISYH